MIQEVLSFPRKWRIYKRRGKIVGDCRIANSNAFTSAPGKKEDRSIPDVNTFTSARGKGRVTIILRMVAPWQMPEDEVLRNHHSNPTGIHQATSGGHPEDGQYLPTIFQKVFARTDAFGTGCNYTSHWSAGGECSVSFITEQIESSRHRHALTANGCLVITDK